MTEDKFENLIRRLSRTLGADRLVTDRVRLYAYGTNAGFYRVSPRLIVTVESEEDAREVMAACAKFDIPLTFRGAGTSLCAQSITDSVLVLLRKGWTRCEVEHEGRSIRLGVRVTGGEANQALLSFGRKIGPDPASLQTASIAGIVSNNSSGMTCGTALNSWNTIEGVRLILADGTLLDTRDERSRESFRNTHPDFIAKILDLARRAKDDPAVRDRILKKYRIKNTVGYSVNSLVEFDDPFDIITHLIVGSEGTLGFLSEVTLKTVEDLPEKATSLMAFDDADAACKALLILKEHPVAAAEFMARRTIAAVEDVPGVPGFLKELGPDAAILIVETRAQTREQLAARAEAITKALESVPMPVLVTFSFDEEECRRIWEIRQGFDALIMAKAPEGAVSVGEDVAIPVERLGEALKDFNGLFERWGYHEAIVFGHALSGNLHFTLLQDFNSPEKVKRFKGFVEELVDVVVDGYDGSLKAEHGTGRGMAPFVEREWGPAVYGLMKEIKDLFDPGEILNRGVIFSHNPVGHVTYLKRYTLMDPMVDACIECGYCERVCVSHGLTVSSRQRIALMRSLKIYRDSGEDPEFVKELERDIPYLVLDTCAACGRCKTLCPSGISISDYVKKLRGERLGPVSRFIAGQAAGHIGAVTSLARAGLSAARGVSLVVGEAALRKCVHVFRDFPRPGAYRWISHLPLPAKSSSFRNEPAAVGCTHEAVYFPSCINRMMGVDSKNPGDEELIPLVRRLCERAGFHLRFAERTENLCCGLAFASKGHREAAKKCEEALARALLDISDGGRLPILCDMSSCLLHMKETLPGTLQLYEPVAFTMTFLAPRLRFRKLPETVAVHPVCSTKNMGLQEMLLQLAKMCAKEVVSTRVECCGFAGDKGFTRPELNRHGLRHLAEQLPARVKRGFSTNRTCEIGLAEESGIPFRSILYLVEECTRE